MLLEAIFGIIAISVVFCCCTFCCYILFQFLLAEEEKTDVPQEPEPWEAMHYYDPLPLRTPSPPDTIFKPTPYTFKLQNGNGVYKAPLPLSQALPHAVINPAVLQYPPGHVLDQQRVPAKSHPVAQSRRGNETKSDRNPPSTKRRSRSRSPSPSPRGAKNVWSTNTEFQPPPNYYQSHRSHHHHQQQQQAQPQRQYVQLTQEHYPIQPKQQRGSIQFSPEEFLLRESQHQQQQHRHSRHHRQEQQQQVQHPEAQYTPFMASTHATNIYTQHLYQYDDNDGRHHERRKNGRSHRSRHKEDVT